LTAPSGILDVEMGLDGFLWVTTASTIYRLVAQPVLMQLLGPGSTMEFRARDESIPDE